MPVILLVTDFANFNLYHRTSAAILQFQYINGKLFAGVLRHADFDAKMRKTLIQCAEFDWSKISPAILDPFFKA